MEDYGLKVALAGQDPKALLASAQMLLGRGDGLTPTGDDLLAAALAGYLLLARAVRHPTNLIEMVTADLGTLAEQRTTSFSASLVKHGCRGRVARPVAGLLRALTGRGSIEKETKQLLDVGHTSGAALAAGLEIGASGLTMGSAQ